MSLPDEDFVSRLPIPTVDALIESIFSELERDEYDSLEANVYIAGDPGVGKTYLYFDAEPTQSEWLDEIDPERTDEF